MNCDCIEKTQKNITEHIGGQNPDWNIIAVGFQHTSLVFTTPAREVVGLPFDIEYEVQSKKGKTLNKKHNVHIFPTFCPFCGVKTEN